MAEPKSAGLWANSVSGGAGRYTDMQHDATNEHCEMDCEVDHISGEDLEETLFYDMGMDENLHDAYQYSKHCLRVFSFLFSPPPPFVYNLSFPLGIENISKDDIDSLKMFHLLQ